MTKSHFVRLCRRYAFEVAMASIGIFGALLSVEDFETLRSFIADSLFGELLVNEQVRKGIAMFWVGGFTEWTAESGHCHTTWRTWYRMLRGIMVLIGEDTVQQREDLRTWIPQVEELVHLTEHELAFRGHGFGIGHPALLFARLHGERLDNWNVAIEVCSAVLEIEEFQPFLRTEACRLLGLAHAKLGHRHEACDAAERALIEARKGRYMWLQVRSLHDLLQWCDPTASAEVASRLAAEEAQLSAPQTEVRKILRMGQLSV